MFEFLVFLKVMLDILFGGSNYIWYYCFGGLVDIVNHSNSNILMENSFNNLWNYLLIKNNI